MTLHCTICGAELDLATLLSAEADAIALERLLAVGYPLGAYLMRYITLHKPVKQALTLRKKIKLLVELLPDVERQAVKRHGRDWAAPRANWALAIDQMMATAQTGGLDLPLKGHGYLYAMLQAMADKAEAAREREQEHGRRFASPATAPVPNAPIGPTGASNANAALAALNERDRNAAPMPDEVRQRLARIKQDALAATHQSPTHRSNGHD